LTDPAGQEPHRASGHDHRRDGQHQAPEQRLGRQLSTCCRHRRRRLGTVAKGAGAEAVAADLPAERPLPGLAGHRGLEGSGESVCAADLAGESVAVKLQAPVGTTLPGEVDEPARLPHLDLSAEARRRRIHAVDACGVHGRLLAGPEGEGTQQRRRQRNSHDRVPDCQAQAGDPRSGVR